MTIEQLFDLVAPLAIYGGADCTYKFKALAAWSKIRQMPTTDWADVLVCIDDLNLSWDYAKDSDCIYFCFAKEAYDRLFEQIVEAHGPPTLQRGHDHWGARGYKLPHQTSKQFELAGGESGNYPWYETAELLIQRLKQIRVAA